MSGGGSINTDALCVCIKYNGGGYLCKRNDVLNAPGASGVGCILKSELRVKKKLKRKNVQRLLRK